MVNAYFKTIVLFLSLIMVGCGPIAPPGPPGKVIGKEVITVPSTLVYTPNGPGVGFPHTSYYLVIDPHDPNKEIWRYPVTKEEFDKWKVGDLLYWK